MSDSTAKPPINEFRARGLSVTIWENDGQTRDGQPVKLRSITLKKSYKDQETGEWKDSNTYFPDDLPRLRLLLGKAYESILLRDTGSTAPPAPADGEFVSQE